MESHDFWESIREQVEQEFPEESDSIPEGQGDEEELDTGVTEEEGQETETDDLVTDEEPEEEMHEEESSEEDEEVTEEEPSGLSEEEVKRNRAFADLRRRAEAAEAELEKAKRGTSLLEKLAEARGMNVDQLLSAVEEAQIEQEARQQNIPPEVYKRLQALEQESLVNRKQAAQARWYSNVEMFAKENNLTEEEVQDTFRYLGESGKWDSELGVGTMPFDEAFFLANRQNLNDLVERRAKELRQQELEERKRREKTTAIPHTGGAAPQPASDNVSDKEFMATMKKYGLDHHFR